MLATENFQYAAAIYRSFSITLHIFYIWNVLEYSKTCVKWPLSKRPKVGFQDQSSINAGQKYCRMLRGEHSAILSTFIMLPFVINIFILSILSGCFTQVLLYMWYTTDLLHHVPMFHCIQSGTHQPAYLSTISHVSLHLLHLHHQHV